MLNDISAVLKTADRREDGPRFSILIPTWNNLAYLRLCLESLRKNSRFSHQIIAVVNEGADGSLDWVRARPDVDYVHARRNLGVCLALNAARRLIQTDYVLYANDDMYFLPDWDAALWEEVVNIGHRAFMLSGTMIEPGGSNPSAVNADYGSDPASFREKELLADGRRLARADWSGATWPPVLVHLDCWDLVGGLSLEFSPGLYSDPDLSRKLWQIGVRTFIGKGRSLVYHFGRRSTGRIKRNDGRRTFLLKWGLSSRVFSTLYLRHGQAAAAALPEGPELSPAQKLGQWLRRVAAVLKSRRDI